MLPLVKVTDMSFHRSSTGRLLGFGEFIIESADSDQAPRTVDHIPYPEQLYLEICGLIFPSRNSSDEPRSSSSPSPGSCGRTTRMSGRMSLPGITSLPVRVTA